MAMSRFVDPSAIDRKYLVILMLLSWHLFLVKHLLEYNFVHSGLQEVANEESQADEKLGKGVVVIMVTFLEET